MADKGKVNYDTFIMRHGLYRNLPKGKLGEPLYCTDTHELYIGQGEDKSPIPVVAQGGSGTDVNGMFFSVDTIAERDALKYTHNIQNGAMCYVASEDMYYKYSNGEWGEANFGTGGGGTTGSLTSEMDEDLTLSVNNDLRISYFFSSPNAGKGNLKVFINGVEVVSNSISQGAGVVTVPESAFTKGATHTLVMYVIDRAEVFTNSLTFYVTYGGLEISTTFDSASSYDVGSTIRCYYTPTSVKTLPIKLYVKIDGELQEPLSCTANTRNTYTFPRTLDAGSHNIQMWVADADGQSNVLMFPLVLLSSDSLVITSTLQNVEAEEGDQVSLDYKVSMKDQTKFNTKYYIDEVLAQTGTCGVVKTAWNTSTLTKGSHKLRLYVETQAKGDDGTTPLATASYTWDVVIVESSYQIVRPVTAGCIGMFTSQDRTNTASDKEIWVGVDEDSREVVADLYNYGYTNTNGWVDNSLISNGSSYVKIPLKPLANDGGKQGVTIDIEFSSRDIGIEDAIVLDCYDEVNDCGIRITKDKAIMKSLSGNSINLDYSQDENTHITLVLNRLDRMAMGYINGILCEAFYLSDTGEGDATQQESFLVDDYIYLNCSHKVVEGVETFDHIGWSKIKNVRIYNIALTNEEVLQNFIANITDKDTQRAKSQFQKGATLPTMTFTGSTKGMGKGKPKTMKITYNSTDELKYGKSFELKNCSVEWQGTSSLQYVVKNYKIKLKDDSGNKYKYNPYGETEALPESTFCLKADYMESSHANNTGLAKFITKYLYQGDTIELSPPRQVYTGVRDTITGFPIRLVINDVQDNGETITKDMGIFNFNLDKGCTGSFGLDTEKYPNCMSYEVAANSDTSAGAFFSYGYQIDENTVAGSEFGTELEYLQNSFELRYPDDKVVGADYGYMTKLKRVIDWVCSMPVETEEQKKAFRDQFPNYFDKGYTLRYLLCVLVFGMVDNLGKNMMLDTWDGQIWYPRFYDLDTSFGLDNSGVLDIPSYCEIEAGTFNTSKSQLWTKVMIAFEKELKTEYQYMRTGKFNEANIMEFMYGEQISKIPEKYYNSDAQTKYLDFGALYLSKLHGNRYEHMKKWLRQRLLYVDTLLDYTSTTDDSITVRAGTLEEIQFHITTYNPMYVRIKWKNGETRKYRSDGKTPFTATYKLDTETDQEVLIYGGSQLKKIDGLSSAMPESMDIANASRLTELVVHSSKLGNINGTTSGGVNISSMSTMRYLDISNCTSLTGALNVSGCNLLYYINAQGTLMNDIQLPSTGANLEEIWYPKTVQVVNMQDMSKLHTVGLEIRNNCKEFSLINCPNVKLLGDRKWVDAEGEYALSNGLFLSGVKSILLDNSCLDFTSLDVQYPIGLEKIELKNMPNLAQITLGVNYDPGTEYSNISDYATPLAGAKSVKISTVNCPNVKTMYITGRGKEGYCGSMLYTQGNQSINFYDATGYYKADWIGGSYGKCDAFRFFTNSTTPTERDMPGYFLANILDIHDTPIENLNIYVSTHVNGIRVPSTLKNLDINKFKMGSEYMNYLQNIANSKLTDTYQMTYGTENNLWTGAMVYMMFPGATISNVQTMSCTQWLDGIIVPNLIGSIWCSDDSYTPVLGESIWNFEGVTLDNFRIANYNIDWGNNGYTSVDTHSTAIDNLCGASSRTLKNLNMKPKNYTPSMYYFPVHENVSLDFSEFTGECLDWALGRLTDEGLTKVVLPTSYANIKYMKSTLYGTNTTKITWQDVEKMFPYTNNVSTFIYNTKLKEQVDESEAIDLINEKDTSQTISSPMGLDSNLQYIKTLKLNNVSNSNGYGLFSGNGSTACNFPTKIGEIILTNENLSNIYNMFYNNGQLQEIGNITIKGRTTGNANGGIKIYKCTNLKKLGDITVEGDLGKVPNFTFSNMRCPLEIGNLNFKVINQFSLCPENSRYTYPQEVVIGKLPDLTECTDLWGAFRNIPMARVDLSDLQSNTVLTNLGTTFRDCNIGEIIGFPSIPSSVTNCEYMFYGATVGSGIPKFNTAINCTTFSSLFEGYKGSCTIYSPFVVPASVQHVTKIFFQCKALPTDFVLDCSKQVSSNSNGSILYQSSGAVNFTYKLPKNIPNPSWSSTGYLICGSSVKSLTLDWAAFEGTAIGLSNLYENISDFKFYGIDWDKFGNETLIYSGTQGITDFSIHSPAYNTNINIGSWRFKDFALAKRFVTECLGTLDCANLIGNWSSGEYNGWSLSSINSAIVPVRLLTDTEDVKLDWTALGSNPGGITVNWYNSNKERISFADYSTQITEATDNGTNYIILSKVANACYVNLSLKFYAENSTDQYNAMIDTMNGYVTDDLLKLVYVNQTQTSKTLTISKIKIDGGAMTTDEQAELVHIATPKGWNLVM